MQNKPNPKSTKISILRKNLNLNKPQQTIPNRGLLDIPYSKGTSPLLQQIPEMPTLSTQAEKQEYTIPEGNSISKLDFQLSEDTPSMSFMTISPLISFRKRANYQKNQISRFQKDKENLETHPSNFSENNSNIKLRSLQAGSYDFSPDATIGKNYDKESTITEKNPHGREDQGRRNLTEQQKKGCDKFIENEKRAGLVHGNIGKKDLIIFEDTSEFKPFNPRTESPQTPQIQSETHTDHGSEPNRKFKNLIKEGFEQTLKSNQIIEKKNDSSEIFKMTKEIEIEINKEENYLNVTDFLKSRKVEFGEIRQNLFIEKNNQKVAEKREVTSGKVSSEASFDFGSDNMNINRKLNLYKEKNSELGRTNTLTNSSLGGTRYEFSPNLLDKIHQNLVENKSEIKKAIHKNEDMRSPNMSQIGRTNGKPPIYTKMKKKNRMLDQRSKSLNEVSQVKKHEFREKEIPKKPEISAPIKEDQIREFLQRRFKNLNFENKTHSGSIWNGISEEKNDQELTEGDLSSKVLNFLERRQIPKNYLVKDKINKNCYSVLGSKAKDENEILRGEVLRSKNGNGKVSKKHKRVIKIMGNYRNSQKNIFEKRLKFEGKEGNKENQDDVKTTRKSKDNILEEIKLIKGSFHGNQASREKMIKRIKVNLFGGKSPEITKLTPKKTIIMNNDEYFLQQNHKSFIHKKVEKNASYDKSYELRKKKQFIVEGKSLFIVDSQKKSRKRKSDKESIRRRLKYVTNGLLARSKNSSEKKKHWNSCLKASPEKKSLEEYAPSKIPKRHFNSAMTVKKSQGDVRDIDVSKISVFDKKSSLRKISQKNSMKKFSQKKNSQKKLLRKKKYHRSQISKNNPPIRKNYFSTRIRGNSRRSGDENSIAWNGDVSRLIKGGGKMKRKGVQRKRNAIRSKNNIIRDNGISGVFQRVNKSHRNRGSFIDKKKPFW